MITLLVFEQSYVLGVKFIGGYGEIVTFYFVHSVIYIFQSITLSGAAIIQNFHSFLLMNNNGLYHFLWADIHAVVNGHISLEYYQIMKVVGIGYAFVNITSEF